MRRLIAVGSVVLGIGCGVDPRLQPAAERPAYSEAQLRDSLSDIGIITGNGLKTDFLLVNALTGNGDRVTKLRTNSLVDAFSDPYTAQALVDRGAAQVLKYLVQCALPAGSSITVSGVTYSGAYAMCPEWQNSAPSQSCLEVVGACLMARNNALGMSVHLGIRGEPDRADAYHFTGDLYDPLRPGPGPADSPVQSLTACTPAGSSWGAQRNCGWRNLELDTCTPGTTTVVAFQSKDPVTCSGPIIGSMAGAPTDVVMRVCSGDSGCDHGGGLVLGESDQSCGTIKPAVRFTCPSTGTFTVMAAPYYLNDGPVTSGWTVHPTEVSQFPLREGAFFGDFFDPAALNIDVEPDQSTGGPKIKMFPVPDSTGRITIYQNMNACSDERWSTADAYRTHRLCADGLGYCLANDIGLCKSQCLTDDGSLVPNDYDFENCKGLDGRDWNSPLTTFLHGGCDLLGPSLKQYCQRW